MTRQRTFFNFLIGLLAVVSASALFSQPKGRVVLGESSYSQLLSLFQTNGWKGSGTAEMHNMALFNWKHTGAGDRVHCDVCGRTEGGWSTHNPAQYHNAGCVFKDETYPKSAAYRRATFRKFGWNGKTGTAVMDNMVKLGWLHTGDGDKVYCPWCQRIEGGWSSHNPAAYHNAGCRFKN